MQRRLESSVSNHASMKRDIKHGFISILQTCLLSGARFSDFQDFDVVSEAQLAAEFDAFVRVGAWPEDSASNRRRGDDREGGEGQEQGAAVGLLVGGR